MSELKTPIDGAIRPRIGAGFRLQWEPAQDCHVLLYPEGMVKLNQSAGEILKRCDGQRSLDDVVRDLETAFNAQGLTKDVIAFVEIAAKQRWLQWD
ncbi:MAG TPA: pyrroloquinoline quinone biosynthesis peptide chaperone PqqD [Burkholderiaceae bacterium]|nr:pyrroloquinoline quinone biosynthesis peptide chaperone PqqD [Burkholderiaceae bacterium]